MENATVENEKIKNYMSELKKDVTIREDNLHDVTLSVPAIKVKWIGILHAETSYLKKLENADKQLLNNACISNPNKPRFQHEAELLANGKLKTLRDGIESQKEVVSFLKEVVNVVIAQFGYDASSCIKLMQIEQQ